MSGAWATITPSLWNTSDVTNSSPSANTCFRSITPSPSVSSSHAMRSRAGRSSLSAVVPGVRTFHPAMGLSFLLMVRPFGYSGVSATHRRPFVSQSMEMAFSTSGSEATKRMSNSGWTASFSAALAGALGPPSG